MTKSQIISTVSGTVAFVSGLTAAFTPFVPLMPERHKPLALAALGLLAAVGARIAQTNQSTNRDHISLPVEQAKQLGIDPSLHGGKG